MSKAKLADELTTGIPVDAGADLVAGLALPAGVLAKIRGVSNVAYSRKIELSSQDYNDKTRQNSLKTQDPLELASVCAAPFSPKTFPESHQQAKPNQMMLEASRKSSS